MKALLRLLLSRKHEELYLDLKRVNVEVQAERRRELDEAPAYRARVKRRMTLGLTAKDMPPLINRERFLAEGVFVFRGRA